MSMLIVVTLVGCTDVNGGQRSLNGTPALTPIERASQTTPLEPVEFQHPRRDEGELKKLPILGSMLSRARSAAVRSSFTFAESRFETAQAIFERPIPARVSEARTSQGQPVGALLE